MWSRLRGRKKTHPNVAKDATLGWGTRPTWAESGARNIRQQPRFCAETNGLWRG
jgi:hypothetical protein